MCWIFGSVEELVWRLFEDSKERDKPLDEDWRFHCCESGRTLFVKTADSSQRWTLRCASHCSMIDDSLWGVCAC